MTMTLRNNTSASVIAKQCDVRCNEFHEIDRIPAGGTYRVNTASDGVDNWWLIADDSGPPMGCVNLLYYHKVDNAVRDLSELQTCPP